MFIYVQFRLLIIAVKKFFEQYKYITKNLTGYQKQTVDMKFSNVIHFYIAVLWAPIKFYIELIFIEHGERCLDAFSTLGGYLISTFVTILLQLFLIVIIPLLLFLILGFDSVLYYLLGFFLFIGVLFVFNKLFRFIFKPIEIKGNDFPNF
jgi:hypothetical protein